MEKRYLATFTMNVKGMFLNGYRWFDTKEEMNETFENSSVTNIIFDVKKYELDECTEIK